MATSGSVDFNLNMADITEEAFERCGLELRTGYDAATARRSLNLLFAEWANRGLNLWTIDEINQTVAQLSSTSSITTYPIGTITLSVASSTSFSVGETITGSSSAATTTVSAVPDLTDVQATVDVLEVVVRRDNSDIGITRINRSDYLNTPNKTTQGRASQYYVDRLITPTITIWPTPENSTDQVIYYRVKRMQDADAGVNTADIPFRFLPCLTAGLAYYLSVKKAPDRIGILKNIYEEEFQRAASEDGERTALRLVPTYSSLSLS
jgi:hypothetical protein